MALAEKRLVLGINCAYHESSAALVRGEEVVFAVEEERFTRIKHAKQARVTNPDELPWNAIRACLRRAPGSPQLSQLDAIAYSLAPGRRLAMMGTDPYPLDHRTGFGTSKGEAEFNSRVLGIPRLLARKTNDPAVADRFHFVSHHRAHAASAFYASPFPSAAILVIDGIGEESTAWLGRGTGEGLELFEEVPYPHSIGMLWERVAVYLGFTEFDACKVMGLAAYGHPDRYAAELDLLFPILDHAGGVIGKDSPPFRIEPEVARLRADDVSGIEALFGPRRSPGESPTLARFADVAAALQRRTEQAVHALAQRLSRATDERDLVFAGGLALNCVSNARLERDGPFRSLFVPCAAHDAGTAIGAALDVANEEDVTAREIRTYQPAVHTPFLGPEYRAAAIESAIAHAGYPFQKVVDAAGVAAALIAEGVFVGWFQGRMEFGPRALGNRSLLADPRRASIRDDLNRRIKHREPFRPFGASVLAEEAERWFKMPSRWPRAALCRSFMNLAYPVHLEQRDRIPAVLHRDDTCRVQLVDAQANRLFHSLISEFEKLTGVPVVLNTSFNDQEPLVATPDDALKTFARTEIDALFLGEYLVRRPA
jgi:carbamoyltransferase